MPLPNATFRRLKFLLHPSLLFSSIRVGLAFFALLFLASPASAQIIENGGFEGSTTSWDPWGPGQIDLSTDSYEGTNACLVHNRQEHWHGAWQDLQGDLEIGKDYHFTAYVKLADPGSRHVRLEIQQTDDRNNGQPRYTSIGDVVAVDTQWTLLEGGFTLHANGPITELKLIINGTFQDQAPAGTGEFDFLVDSVVVAENDWRPAADARIALHRKRDVELKFVSQTGNPVANMDVNVQQIKHRFAFGSTLNDAVRTDPIYADFFKQNFEWATIEWFSQWKPTEQVQGVEDYSKADFAIDFAQSNGISVKGHALAYPSTTFLPDWLLSLSPAEVQAELDERIINATNHFGDDLFGWDVSNEMLDEDWLADTLGESYRPAMFQLARQEAPNADLLTNEHSLTNSTIKTQRYYDLIQGLVTDGADVGGIGLQSHFYEGFVSPKGIEIAVSKLSTLGIDIWFTEFDFENPDADVRAENLEDFYRYAFSLPEARGINMWGFWAGTHWRGADASMVDLDWTVNAQGQRYFDLIDEWTTSLDDNSGSDAEVLFNGFHGTYLVTTVHPVTGRTNYHLVNVEPGTDPLTVQLVTNSTDGSLSIYGTSGDDLFEFDLETTDRVDINGQTVMFSLPTPLSTVNFVGLGGDDRLETLSESKNQHFRIREDFMAVVGDGFRVQYDQIEEAYFYARQLGSTVTFVDSAGDDTLSSTHEESTLETPNVKLIADNFRFLYCTSTAGNDTAWLYDTAGVDRLYTDLDVVSLRWGARNRRVWDFAVTNIVSTEASDIATVDLPLGAKTISVSPDLLSIDYNGKLINAIEFSRSTFNGAVGNSDSVSFSGDDGNQILRVSENSLRYSSSGFWALVKDVNQSTHSTQSGGFDRVILTDSSGDDTLSVDQDATTLTSSTMSHSWLHMDNVRAISSNGGTDTATVANPTGVVTLVGDWE